MSGGRGWVVAAVAVAAGCAVAAAAWWARTHIANLEIAQAALEARLRVTRDTLAMVLGPHSRSIAIPVTTGGRLGAVTIFEDTAARRWLVRCENVARSERDQAYQLWLFTEAGVRSARTWALDQDAPWVALIDLPVGTAVVGVALSIEPRGGSAEPTGPTVFTHVW